MDGLGLGWIVSLAKGKRPLILAKSGGIAGFMTYVVLAPTRGVGVFVAVNRLNFALIEGLTSGVRELVADLARAETRLHVRISFRGRGVTRSSTTAFAS